jgi:hypothetical protein
MKRRDEGRITCRAEGTEGRTHDVRAGIHAELEQRRIGGLSGLGEPADQLEALNTMGPRELVSASLDALLEAR